MFMGRRTACPGEGMYRVSGISSLLFAVPFLSLCVGVASGQTRIHREEREEQLMKNWIATLLAVLLALTCANVAFAEGEEQTVILVVSFGTSYNENRAATIDAIEADIAAAFEGVEVRRAFTSQTIIDKLAQRDGLKIDNVTEAMQRLVADGVERVVVQPTHVMPGYEYDDAVAEVNAFADQFEALAIGAPLLYTAEDYDATIDAVMAEIPEVGDEETAIVFMGHGTEHYANATYSMLEKKMHSMGYVNAFVGTVEGFPTLEDVIASLNAYGAKKVVLYPFMIVAGDHANNDMAGDDAGSWKSMLSAAGFEVECRVQGLGQNARVRERIVEHVRVAMADAGM